jgi:clan AA aspartic protease (TIGR02281 family)
MKCKNCGIPLKPYYTFCPNCGTGLKILSRRFGAQFVSAILVMAIFLSLGYLTIHRTGLIFSFFQETDTNGNANQQGKRIENPRFSKVLFPFLKVEPAAARLTPGQVLLSDIAGNQIARITAAVSFGGWVAIPSDACVGALEWHYQAADGSISEISGGILGDTDDVGLWQMKNTLLVPGEDSPLAISPVRLDRPLIWVSLVSDQTVSFSDIATIYEQMNFFLLPLPASINEPGAFIQDGRLVGWTFGNLLDAGYLWKGPDEDNLVLELGVDDFYRLTFAGGREEQMTIAYAMGDGPQIQYLKALADGFRLPTMLSEVKTPPHLRTEALVKEIRAVMSKIIDAGNSDLIPGILDGPVLAGTNDLAFMMDVLTMMAQTGWAEAPVSIIDDIMNAHSGLDENGLRQLQEFRSALTAKIQKNGNETGNGKIIIRFSPDSGQIRAKGVLNNLLNQNFAVDTGASMVTIPSSAAKALGLDTRSAPRRKVITAGGVIEAPEVILDALEFNGWVEYDVTAYIIDLPEQTGLGLLGLNYLNRFRMDVNAASGELTLEPR